jgi:hypothetical protein
MARSSERALLNFPEGALFNTAGMNGILYLRLTELGGDAPPFRVGSFTGQLTISVFFVILSFFVV